MRAALFALLLATSLQAQNVVRSGPWVVESWTSNNRLAAAVIAEANKVTSLPGLPAAAPAFGQPIRIVLADNDARFRAATGGRAPDWGAGVAVPEEGLIALRAYGGRGGAYDELRPVLRHEIAHVALHRYFEHKRIPRWFDEGYAMWSAGEIDTRGEWRLRIAFATGAAPPLDSLGLAWPAMSGDAETAYLLAASVVKYLINESGTRALELFMKRWHDSGSFEGSLATTYGLSVDQLETHWQRDVRRRYGWFAVLVQSAAFASFAAVGVLALYVVRRRRDRLRLAQLKATEPPDLPAYWTETEMGIDPEPGESDIGEYGKKDDT